MAAMYAWIFNFVFEKGSGTLAPLMRAIKDLIQNTLLLIPRDPNKAC